MYSSSPPMPPPPRARPSRPPPTTACRPRTGTAGSSATSPATCTTAVTTQTGVAAGGQAAREVGETVGERPGQGEVQATSALRSANLTRQDNGMDATSVHQSELDAQVRHTGPVQSSEDVADRRRPQRPRPAPTASDDDRRAGRRVRGQPRHRHPGRDRTRQPVHRHAVQPGGGPAGRGRLRWSTATPHRGSSSGRAERRPLWTSPAGSSAVFRIGTDPPDVVELWDWTLQPGDAFDGEAHPIGTVEVLSVLAGKLAPADRRRRAGTGHRRHRDVRGPRPAPLRLRRSPSRCASRWSCCSPVTPASCRRRASPRRRRRADVRTSPTDRSSSDPA